MSAENRPNINAVGLMTDVYASIEKYVRGPAKDMGMLSVMHLLQSTITNFVEDVSDKLDKEFGRQQ